MIPGDGCPPNAARLNAFPKAANPAAASRESIKNGTATMQW